MKELVAIFPVLRDWIADFLDQNKCMFASEIGHNMLIEQVRICYCDKYPILFITLIPNYTILRAECLIYDKAR